MVPQAYEAPTAILLVFSGALACFAGYRLFRIVLAIYGFIAGAMLASSMMGVSNAIGMVAAAIVGGIVGALILGFAYFVGIALVGAGLGALVVHVGWSQMRTGDPPIVLLVVVSIVGAMAAMLLQRYVIVVATAFAGAWTMLIGGLALAGDRAAARSVGAGDVWIFYPTTPPGGRWVLAAWAGLGLLGVAVQLGVTARRRR